ncbi:MAG: plasmid partitioning protein RepB, partial [Beijerinckiaceae bacterium]
ILAAMSLYKSDLSNMLTVIGNIPQDIVDAIGPAPGVGRRGWIELAACLGEAKTAIAVRKIVQAPDVQVLESDERFKRALESLKPKTNKSKIVTWSTEKGDNLAKVVLSNDRLSLRIDRQKSPEFAEFVLNQLRDLYQEFQTSSSERS